MSVTTGWVTLWVADGFWQSLGDFESEAKARRFIDRHPTGGEFLILPADVRRPPPDTRPTIRVHRMNTVERTNTTRTPGVHGTARTAPPDNPRRLPAVVMR